MLARRLKGAAIAVALSVAIAATAILIAGAARAEDPGWNRTGPYVGVLAGYDLVQLEAQGIGKSASTIPFGGAFGGLNIRQGDLVYGLEGDFLLTDIKGTSSASGVTVSASSHYLASVRGRVGLPAGPALLFATAGVAFTDHSLSATAGPFSNTDKGTMDVGAAFGGGVDMELTRAVFVRLDAIHYWFPDNSMPLGFDQVKSANQETLIRVGLGIKLN